MQKRGFLSLAGAGLLGLAAAGLVLAQGSVRLVADIPFEFMVGNEALPAGEYSITNAANPKVLLVNHLETHTSAFAITNRAQYRGTPSESKLVFNKYGDRYFLSQLWTVGESTGCQLPMQRAERELVSRAANHQRVTVLAKR